MYLARSLATGFLQRIFMRFASAISEATNSVPVIGTLPRFPNWYVVRNEQSRTETDCTRLNSCRLQRPLAAANIFEIVRKFLGV